MSDRDDVRNMVTGLYAQADVEMRRGNVEIARTIENIADEINLALAPADRVADIVTYVNQGDFEAAKAIIRDSSFPENSGMVSNRTLLGLGPPEPPPGPK